MKEVRSEIEIDASPDRIWQILTNFSAYPEWNPFITRASGVAKTDARLSIRIEPPGGRAMTLKPRVLRTERNRELRWLGRLWGIGGLFEGEHALSIQPLDGGRARVVQQESFRGLLLPLLKGTVDATQKGLEAMNQALKARAEQSSGG
ncbi:MAG: SRPBCC domain-containing protein [Anaerolineae bacterium]|nr:SRPBCC domain-containing protein [Anaerolineae bacterium]